MKQSPNGSLRIFTLGLLTLLLAIISLGPLAIPHARTSSVSSQEQEQPDLAQQREEWFYRQRAYPHKYVPAGAHLRALRQLDEQLAAEKAARPDSTVTPLGPNPSWSFIGPEPIDTPYTDPVVSGRVSALAIDPGNVNNVYLGGAQGGVWKSTNGGTNWTPLTDLQASTAIGSIVLDPANSNIIYVGTGEENFAQDSYYGAGILKSTDGGSTWTQMCGPFCGPVGQDGFYGGGARIGGLAVHPTNSQILLAAVALLSNDGVYRSTDAGNTWTKVVSGNPGNSVIFDPTNGNIAYASLGSSFSGGTESVFKSTDSGQTWTADNGTGANVLPSTNAGRIVLAMAASSTSTLYAGIANVQNGNLLGFFKTTDGGANWTQLTSTPDYCTPQCWYDHVIAVQPTNANVVFAGGAYSTTLVRSTDGGTTWSVLQSAQNSGFLHADMHALAFFPDGNTLYLGNDGGAYSTTQITATNPSFTALNSNLGLTQFYAGLSIHPTNPAIAIGGNQRNGTVIYSGTLTWNDVVCGDGSATAIDFTNPSTMYASCNRINIFKSTSSGTFGSWSSALSGINTGDRVDFIPPLAMDPSNPQTLYFGTYRVYQTTNGASSWTAISPDLTGGPSFFGVISAITVAPSDSNTLYIGTMDNRVQVTTNAGSGASATWTNVSAGLPPRVVTHIAVDPNTASTAYATFSGFTGFGDTQGHVFKTTNFGSAWTDISTNLPNTPVNALVIVPDVPNTLFAGTDIGVFYSTNGGTSWTSLVNGLPRVAVLGLTLHNPSRTLRASTHGRSAWDLNIASLVPPLLTSVVSRMTHPGAGDFNVNMPLPPNSSPRGVECRSSSSLGAGNYKLVFTFTANLTSVASASVSSGTGSVSGSPIVSGNTCTVNLTGVSTGQYIAVTLNNVVDATGAGASNITSPQLGILTGDVNANGVVSNTDVSLVKGQVTAPVGLTNFREDVNANGVISNTDVSVTKAQVGNTLPSTP